MHPCFGLGASGQSPLCVLGSVAFIIGSGQIEISPEEGPRFPSDSVEAAALMEDWGAGLTWGSGTAAEALGAVSGGSWKRRAEAGALGSGEASACGLLDLQEPTSVGQVDISNEVPILPFFTHLTNMC